MSSKLYRDPIILALGAIISWSTVATAFRLALEQISWFAMLTVSVSCATVVFLVVAIIQGKLKLISRLSSRELVTSALLGVLNPLLYYIVLFKAYDMLPAQIALPLNYTWPIAFIIIFSIVQRQVPRALQIVGMCLSFGGIIAISSYKSYGVTLSPVGVTLALMSSVMWAIYWLLNIKNRVDNTIMLLIGFVTASIILNVTALIMGLNLYTTALSYAAYIGCFEMSVPFILWSYALSRSTNKPLINQLSYLAPILSLTLINFYLGERLSLTTIIGAALIIIGIIVAQMRQKKEDGF